VTRALDNHAHFLRRAVRQARFDRAARPIFLLLALSPGLCACDDSMTVQRKNKTYSPSSLWSDGTSARPLPNGVVAQGDLLLDKEAEQPPAVTPELLARGQERFEIFCAPCHGLAGEGDGIVVKRGFPAPPSFEDPKLRAMPARQLFDAIGNGYGAMYPFATRVPPADRWAIVAYIRALQLAGDATLADAPEAAEKLQ
jgi:mono/diheme cytochrome c family protein